MRRWLHAALAVLLGFMFVRLRWGLYPFDASDEAYKLGVNYVIYGLTH